MAKGTWHFVYQDVASGYNNLRDSLLHGIHSEVLDVETEDEAIRLGTEKWRKVLKKVGGPKKISCDSPGYPNSAGVVYVVSIATPKPTPKKPNPRLKKSGKHKPVR